MKSNCLTNISRDGTCRCDNKNVIQNQIRTKINIGITVKTTNKTTCM